MSNGSQRNGNYNKSKSRKKQKPSKQNKKAKSPRSSRPNRSKSPRSSRPTSRPTSTKGNQRPLLHQGVTIRHEGPISNGPMSNGPHNLQTPKGNGSGTPRMMDPAEQELIVTNIMRPTTAATPNPLQTRGPPSKQPAPYQYSQQIRQFMNQNSRNGQSSQTPITPITPSGAPSRQMSGPSMSSAMSHAVSVGSSAAGKLTPQMNAMQTPRSPDHLDLLKDVESTENDDSGDTDDRKIMDHDDDRKMREQRDDCLTRSRSGESGTTESTKTPRSMVTPRSTNHFHKSPDFGFKPDDYKKREMEDLDDELMKEFEDIDSSDEESHDDDEEEEEDDEGDSEFESESRSDIDGELQEHDRMARDRGRTTTPNAEEMENGMIHDHRNGHHTHLGDHTDDEQEVSDKDKPVLVQSESTMASSTNGLCVAQCLL